MTERDDPNDQPTAHQQDATQQQDITLNDARADMAQAFTDLLRGEKQATALESQLSSIEKKIDDLLAQADRDQRDIDQMMEEETAQRRGAIEGAKSQDSAEMTDESKGQGRAGKE